MADDLTHSPASREQRELGTACRASKRAIELGLSLVAGVITAPILLILFSGSAMVFRANPLFVQHRVGRNGRIIPVPKVRTIPADAPSSADKRQLARIPIPPWGRFLRRRHLDELPQVWSVLIGHMSLVGPRPEMPWLAERFDPTVARLRASVRPGITGLWQISTASGGLINEAPEYDLVYLKMASPRFDLWIMWRTVLLYLPGGHTITLDDLPHWAQPGGGTADDLSTASSGGQ